MIAIVPILAFMAIFLFGWGISIFIRSGKLEEENVALHRLRLIKQRMQKQAPLSLSTHRAQKSNLLNRLIQGSGLKISPAAVVALCLLLGAGFLFLSLLITGRPLAALLSGGLGSFLPIFHLRRVRKKRLALFERQFPDAVALMASCLKAGHGLTAAISAVGSEMAPPVSEEFSRVLGEINLGAAAKEAFIHMEERIGSRDLRFFSAAVLLQKEVGGSLAEVFTNLEETIRERFELKGELKAMTAQQRLTAWILGLLPIGMGTIVYLLNAKYFSTLFEDPLGHFFIVAAAILQILGFFSLKKVMAISFD